MWIKLAGVEDSKAFSEFAKKSHQLDILPGTRCGVNGGARPELRQSVRLCFAWLDEEQLTAAATTFVQVSGSIESIKIILSPFAGSGGIQSIATAAIVAAVHAAIGNKKI